MSLKLFSSIAHVFSSKNRSQNYGLDYYLRARKIENCCERLLSNDVSQSIRPKLTLNLDYILTRFFFVNFKPV